MATRQIHKLRGGITYLPVEEITPNPTQPRKHFNAEGLEELARSIREHGVLQPLTVRLRGEGYELIAGERRLRASKIAGLTEVPCVLLDVSLEESSLIALVENLQRKDLDVVEEAEGIERLIRMFGMSQEEAARRLGKSQSAVANKLRLLRLPPDILDKLRSEELSERHGRALLRLRSEETQRAALDYIIAEKLNVAATESFVEYLMNTPLPDGESGQTGQITDGAEIIDVSSSDTALNTEALPEQEIAVYKRQPDRTFFALGDVKIFLNSLARGLNLMRSGGVDVGFEKRETETNLVLTISIPKNR